MSSLWRPPTNKSNVCRVQRRSYSNISWRSAQRRTAQGASLVLGRRGSLGVERWPRRTASACKSTTSWFCSLGLCRGWVCRWKWTRPREGALKHSRRSSMKIFGPARVAIGSERTSHLGARDSPHPGARCGPGTPDELRFARRIIRQPPPRLGYGPGAKLEDVGRRDGRRVLGYNEQERQTLRAAHVYLLSHQLFTVKLPKDHWPMSNQPR